MVQASKNLPKKTTTNIPLSKFNSENIMIFRYSETDGETNSGTGNGQTAIGRNAVKLSEIQKCGSRWFPEMLY